MVAIPQGNGNYNPKSHVKSLNIQNPTDLVNALEKMRKGIESFSGDNAYVLIPAIKGGAGSSQSVIC